jgi:hypothetical protein
MSKFQLSILSILVLGAALVRLFSVANQPFFCDVHIMVHVLESGGMTIQFPGYAPYHLIIKFLGFLFGSLFAGALVFSFLCGMGALGYCIAVRL